MLKNRDMLGLLKYPNSSVITKRCVRHSATRKKQTKDPFGDRNTIYKYVTNKLMKNKGKNTLKVLLDPTTTVHELLDVKLHSNSKPPKLVDGLNRALYQPVILHQLKDPRTNIYNFDPKLEVITSDLLEHKAFGKDGKDDNPIFITPHKDGALLKVAKTHNKKYISSTSSMTSALSQLHYLLSNFRQLNIMNSSISKHFPQRHCDFTRGAHLPTSIIIRKKEGGVKSIDSDRSLDKEMVLSILGHSLEDFLTERVLKPNEKPEEHYHYSKIDNFILRSQLDAYDPKLPGSGIFDLKTRAVTSIRHDLPYVEKKNNFTGYEIDKVYGQFESLEREFFELIRSTLIKYSMQARIGVMDGIFVAYHNISKMFGFQYLPLDELDYVIHSAYDKSFEQKLIERENTLKEIYGQKDFIISHQRQEREIAFETAKMEFKMSLMLFRNILDHIESQLQNKDWQLCKVMLKTEKETLKLPNGKSIEYPVMNVIAYPLPEYYEDIPLSSAKDEKELKSLIDKVEKKNKELIKSVDRSIIGFKINVVHHQSHHPQTQTLPDFAKPNNKILNSSETNFVNKKLLKKYYPSGPHFETPNFFHPLDVQEWQSSAIINPISNKKTLRYLCNTYITMKFDALKFQSIVRDDVSIPKKEQIARRIKELIIGKAKKEKKQEIDDTEPTEFQQMLRGYGIKGENKNKRNLVDKEQKLMWNT